GDGAQGRDPCGEIVLLVLDRHELELAHAVYAYVHDYMQPTIVRLTGALRQTCAGNGHPLSAELEMCTKLIKDVDDLKEEFREYWRLRSSSKDEGALLSRCVNVAWEQARRMCGQYECEPSLISRLVSPAVMIPSLSERAMTRALQNIFANAVRH